MTPLIDAADLRRAAELGSRDVSGGMLGGCTDYRCECHDLLPLVVDEVRRLRGLIERCHALSRDVQALTPGRGVVGAWRLEGPIVRELIAEAEAIRGEGIL